MRIRAKIALPDGSADILTYETSAACRSCLRADLVEDDFLWLPDDQFSAHRRVPDDQHPRFVWKDGGLYPGPTRAPRSGGIIVLVESPHKDEFQDGGRGEALGPLRRKLTNSHLKKHLPGLLDEAARRLDIGLREVDVVVVNSVQYQASLAACYRTPRTPLLKDLRNDTWRALFRKRPIRDDLACRIQKLKPVLILVAATRDVQPCVGSFVAGTGSRYLEVDRHPSGWAKQPQISN